MTNKIREEGDEKHGERVLSAHILPHKFPINPDKMIYPDIKNASNPLYYTTNTTYGNEQPREFCSEFCFCSDSASELSFLVEFSFSLSLITFLRVPYP